MSEVELGHRAFWWVAALGASSGAFSLLAFRRWSDAEKLRVAGNAVAAHLMEFRLFPNEPLVIFRAQRELLVANGRLLWLLLGPMVLLTMPFALLLAIADAFFGRAPLRAKEAAVVTAHYRSALPPVQLRSPPGFSVETLPVQVRSQNEVSWRIRPNGESRGTLQLRWGSQVLGKTVSSAPGLQWISEQRSASVLSFLAHPREPPYIAGAIDWVSIQYPAATIFGYHWLVWFSLAACGGALLTTLGDVKR